MSKTKFKSVKTSLINFAKSDKSYSFSSMKDFMDIILQSTKELHEMGYKISHIKGFKHKHIIKLIEHWKSCGASSGTIKNRMSKLRHLDRAMGGRIGIHSSNDKYNINKRTYASLTSKAQELPNIDKYNDSLIRLSIRGQRVFGLRREESIKIIMSEAIGEKHIRLKPSWTKGNIGRLVPITNKEQRQWIQDVLSAVKSGQSLIPQGKSYKSQLMKYMKQMETNKHRNFHGLRHAYAQQRYRELTKLFDRENVGIKCPHESGVLVKDLTNDQKAWDLRARHIISRELGHSRVSIMKNYLG